MKKVIVLSLGTILARFIDVFSTFLATPELDKELNPIVRFFNAGWTGVIVLNIFVCIIFIGVIYFYNEKYFKELTQKKFNINSFKEYVSYIYYNVSDKFNYIYTRTPNNKRAFIYHILYALSISHLYYSTLLFFNNLSIAYFRDHYIRLCELVHLNIPKYLIVIGLMMFFVAYRSVLKKEFKKIDPISNN